MLVALRFALLQLCRPFLLLFVTGLTPWLTFLLLGPLQRLAVLAQVELEDVDVTLEAQGIDRPQQILPIDSLALLILALLAGLARDEGDKLRDALLDSFLGVFGDLGVLGERLLHDATDIGDREKPRVVGTHSGLIASVLVSVLIMIRAHLSTNHN